MKKKQSEISVLQVWSFDASTNRWSEELKAEKTRNNKKINKGKRNEKKEKQNA